MDAGIDRGQEANEPNSTDSSLGSRDSVAPADTQTPFVDTSLSVSMGGNLRKMVEDKATTPDTAISSAKLVEARTLKGFRDILPSDAIVKNHMLSTLARVFESFGFVPIQTPHLEYTECLFGDAGPEIQKQVYRFQDHGKRDVAMRFDLTVPFARFISQHKNEVGLPFKRWAIGEVFRGENTQAGRYREFTQCDFDFVGTESLASDTEIVQVIDASLSALGVQNFQIRINNRKIMNGLVAALGAPEKASVVLQEIDKLDKVGIESVRAALTQEHGLSSSAVDALMNFVTLSTAELSNSEVLDRTRNFQQMHPLIAEGLAELETVTQLLSKIGITDPKIRIDLSIARGLGYYTGIVYETILLDRPRLGSVCSGGRYDNLTQTFQKDRCPGVGASVGIDRLIAGLQDLGLIPSISTTAKVLVTQPRTEVLEQAMAITAALRANGIPVELYPDPHKMKKQIDYARRAGHPYLVTFAPNGSEFVFEDMANGQRTPCDTIEDLVSLIAKKIC